MPTPFAYVQGKVVPIEDAKISVMTHALHYGTAVFEGIRGNWNDAESCHYLFRMREHYERLHQSAKIMMLTAKDSVDRLCEVTVDLVERGGFEGEDVYIRPLVYTSSEVLGVRVRVRDRKSVV